MPRTLLLALVLVFTVITLRAQPPPVEWRSWGADKASTKASVNLSCGSLGRRSRKAYGQAFTFTLKARGSNWNRGTLPPQSGV